MFPLPLVASAESLLDDFFSQGDLKKVKAVTFFSAEFEDGKVKRLFSETTYSDSTKYTALTGLVLKGHEDMEVLILNDEVPTPKVDGVEHETQQGIQNLDSDLSIRVLGELVPERTSLQDIREQYSQSCESQEYLVRLSLQNDKELEIIEKDSELWPGIMKTGQLRSRLFYLAGLGCLKVVSQ